MSKSKYRTMTSSLPVTDLVNEAGGKAYSFPPKQALAQLAATGCLNNVYYTDANDQLEQVIKLCAKIDAEFIAKTAVYAHQAGYMKDMPALLCVILSKKSPELLDLVFDQVIDNGKMLRNFVEIIRSGICGRRSLGSNPKRLVKRWFNQRSERQIFFASIGANPSLGDIIRLCHVNPESKGKIALYRWLLNYDEPKNPDLPDCIKNYQTWKYLRTDADGRPDASLLSLLSPTDEILPDVPFLMLINYPLTVREWQQLIVKLPWNALRMNIATMARQGAFASRENIEIVAKRLADSFEIEKSSVFPYQVLQTLNTIQSYSEIISDSQAEDKLKALRKLLGAQVPAEFFDQYYSAVKYNYFTQDRFQQRNRSAKDFFVIPQEIITSLYIALENSVSKLPSFDNKKTYVCVDVSGSMESPVTGYRVGATTTTRCVDVAALFAAGIVRKNPAAKIIPFSWEIYRDFQVSSEDCVANITHAMTRLLGGGTNCSAPLTSLNAKNATGDLIIYLSDNESWIDSSHSNATATLKQWQIFKQRNPTAKMVCIDLQPYTHSQAKEADDIMNIGGFSDSIFAQINNFVQTGKPDDHWVETIEKIQLTKT